MASRRPVKSSQVKERSWWQISRIKSTPAAHVGRVEAADAEEAIQVAIKEYHITDPHQQSRLMARRVG